jgi:adenylate kinase family enzyme
LPAAILAGNAAGKVDPMNLVLLGPPGVGRGTQGRLLAERLDVRWLSSGDILRDTARGESELGKQVEKSMRQGDLVADGVILEIMEGRLRRADAMRGFILDGFPRTRGQTRRASRRPRTALSRAEGAGHMSDGVYREGALMPSRVRPMTGA